MAEMFFDDAQALLRTLVVGVLAYAALVAMLRISGKRTLAKMNAFDFVVTVALGSTLATILLNNDVSLAQGVLALAVLIGLQFAISWAGVRMHALRRIVTGEPVLLARGGQLNPRAMKRSRIREEEVRAAVRGAGLAELADAEAVVFETDGSISVIAKAVASGPAQRVPP